MTAANELSLSQVTVRLYDLRCEVDALGASQDHRNEAIGLAIVGFSKLEQSKGTAESLGEFVLALLNSDNLSEVIDQVDTYLINNSPLFS